MNKKIAVIDECLKILMSDYFKERADVVFWENISAVDSDILVLNNCSGVIPTHLFAKTTILNLHPALLPSFANNNAIVHAYTSGVKVSGVTVHYVENDNFYGKIIAQYPIIIDSTMHYNEYVETLTNIGNKLYPHVVDAVLNDKVYDFSDLFRHKCSSGCSSCGGCNK